jgi:pimeloyl-ACP methyl ester carboxylesterase
MALSDARTITVALPPHAGEGLLGLPSGQAAGVVLFAHGSGSCHLSPRNRFVAASLQRAGLATLLFDLLTDREAADRSQVFDVSRLADRLGQAANWVARQPVTHGLPLGLFGASTGAAAALVCAADRDDIAAVVSRGGRPDLAHESLPRLCAPTLLIVGGADDDVLAHNRAAARRLRCEHQLAVVPGATHLFEEPGALDQVVALACAWFLRHLIAPHLESHRAVP